VWVVVLDAVGGRRSAKRWKCLLLSQGERDNYSKREERNGTQRLKHSGLNWVDCFTCQEKKKVGNTHEEEWTLEDLERRGDGEKYTEGGVFLGGGCLDECRMTGDSFGDRRKEEKLTKENPRRHRFNCFSRSTFVGVIQIRGISTL